MTVFKNCTKFKILLVVEAIYSILVKIKKMNKNF